MEAIFEHDVIFGTSGDILVSDVARSLLANEEMLRLVGSVLENCFDGLVVQKIDVKFKSSTTNSPLKESLIVSIFTTWQSDINKVIPPMWGSITGVEIPDKYASVVTVLTIVIAIYGIDWAYKKFKGKKDSDADGASTSIHGNENTILQIAGDVIGAKPEDLAAAIERAIKPAQRDSVARKALEFIRPAKREPGATISGGGAVISAEAIAAAPTDLDIESLDEEEPNEPIQRQVVAIHATDIDRSKSGWAGHLPGRWNKRLRMQIYPGIDNKSIFGKTQIIADIILVSKPNKHGDMVPYLFHVLKVYD